MPKVPTVFSLPLKGSEVEGSSPIYRHPDFQNELLTELSDKSIKTVWDMFDSARQKYPNANCHGVRQKGKPFVWQTYAQVYERIMNFASGVNEFMMPDATGKMKLLGLMGLNSPDWSVAEYACLCQSGTTVPLYTTTPRETLEFLFNQNGCAVVVCDAPSADVLTKAKPGIAGLKTLIVYGKFTEEQKKSAEAAGLQYLSFKEIEDKGKANKKELTKPTGDTVMSFIFTSGSTGMPKGALLSHNSTVAVIAGSFYNLTNAGMVMRPGKEVHLSYLPSAHVMERAFQTNVYFVGGAVGYYQGIREELLDDLKTLRPTMWPSVPRLLNMIHDKIMGKVRAAGGVKLKIFMTALNTKIAGLRNGKLKHGLWDALAFKKVKKQLGLDRCEFIVTGSAPIAGPVLDFYRAVIGCPVVEGYGATETCAAAAQTHPLHFSSEHVGGPTAANELKLVSLPEMKYLVTDDKHNGMAVRGRGEICVRGKVLMNEYYRNPEATAKAIDKDGWYHTGDVGCILPNGSLKIFDRVGNVFKLSIGEYVAPEKIENVCLRSELVAAIFAHGDALHPKMVGIVVPDVDGAAAWAKANGVGSDVKELSKNEDFRKAILSDIDKVARKNGLQSFEIPKDIFLEPEPFSVETVLTPTLKMQRKKAIEFYGEQLKKMLGEPA